MYKTPATVYNEAMAPSQSLPTFNTFGEMLHYLRRQARLTQSELAIAVGYSESMISRLEHDERAPNTATVLALFVPALCVEEQPDVVAQLVKLADASRQQEMGRVTPGSPQPPAPSRQPLSMQHNLPLQPTPFIGRRTELARIASLLANPDCRLLTMLGAGGVGKTRLAIEAARWVLDSVTVEASKQNAEKQDLWVAGEVCFISLASVENTDLVLATIAKSLELQITGSELQAEIIAHLQQRSLLLVLDNFEHLPEATDIVAQLLQGAASIKILATSRERLHLREEWLMPVDGLALAGGLLSEAGQLFVSSVLRVQPDFSSYGQEEAIAAICRQVEGMPLAIELAASWVRVMPCAEIARQLAQNLQILTTTLHNVTERHRSFRALFDQSWRLLSLFEQSLLRRVSVFRGGWTPDEGAQVAGATLPDLVGLVDKSLVRTNGQGRFDLHELVRQYAAEQLAASGEVDHIRQRHHGAYLQLFRTGDSHLRGPEAATWIERLAAEQDNLRAALHWALGEARYTDLAWLLVAATYYFNTSGQRYEEAGWLTRLLPHRASLPVELRLATMVDFLAASGSLAEFSAHDTYLAEMVELMELCPYKQLQSTSLVFMAFRYPTVDQTATALARSVQLVRGDDELLLLGPEFGAHADRNFLLAANLCLYAMFLISQGQMAQAAPMMAESHALFRSQGHRIFEAECLGGLGLVALLRSDLAEAEACLQEVVAISREHNLPATLCEYQPLLALVNLYRGNEVEANRLLEDSLQLCLQVRNTDFLARVCTYLADAALWQGNCDEASRWLAQSLAYAGPAKYMTIHELQRLFTALRLAAAQGDYHQAAALAGMAEAAHTQLHNIYAGPMLPLVEAALAAARTTLGSAAFDEAFAAGQQWSPEDAYTGLYNDRAPSSRPTTRARMGYFGSP
jgi:predicted ATPase